MVEKKTVAVDSKISAQILLDGAQEVLGMETMQKVLARFVPQTSPLTSEKARNYLSSQSGAFFRALEEIYGVPGRNGLALRIGRAAFRHVLNYYGDQAGFRKMEYRLLPAPRRLGSGLLSLAKILAEETGSQITVSEEDTCWLWSVQPGSLPASLGPASAAGSQECYLTAGLLQEFTMWAGGGRFYPIMETECRGNGSQACLYRIEKKPLD